MSELSLSVDGFVRAGKTELIKPIAVISDVTQAVLKAQPIDLALAGEPMALVDKIVVGDVSGNDL